MTVYFVINEMEDLEPHFDLEYVYFTKGDLIRDLREIKDCGFSIYSADNTISFNNKNKLTKHTFSEFEEGLKESDEYKEYLRLSKIFGHDYEA